MNLSAKTEYACIAVLDLALHHEQGDPVRIRSIADNHGIPSRFLVQILLQLKAAGIVSSIRGASGGYRLAKDPQDISLAEVMTAIDGRGAGSQCNTGDTPVTRTLHRVWMEAEAAEQAKLECTSFAEMAKAIGENELVNPNQPSNASLLSMSTPKCTPLLTCLLAALVCRALGSSAVSKLDVC